MDSSADVGRAVASHVLNHHDRFEGIKQGLAAEVESSVALIKVRQILHTQPLQSYSSTNTGFASQELLEDLDSTKAALQRTQLDLVSERDGRRRLQQEIIDEKALAETRGRRPFVIALIDADTECYFVSEAHLSTQHRHTDESHSSKTSISTKASRAAKLRRTPCTMSCSSLCEITRPYPTASISSSRRSPR